MSRSAHWAVRGLGMPMSSFSRSLGYQSHRSAIQSPAAKGSLRQGTAVCSKPKKLAASLFTDVANALLGLDFEVIERLNADRKEMLEAIKNLGSHGGPREREE